MGDEEKRFPFFLKLFHHFSNHGSWFFLLKDDDYQQNFAEIIICAVDHEGSIALQTREEWGSNKRDA